MSVTGTCHCGATRFTVAALPETVTECNCTFCSKRGALWAYYPSESVSLTVPAGSDSDYARNGMMHHHFCATCGCTTYTVGPAWTAEGQPDFEHPRYSLNARLFDDVDLKAIPVVQIDGRNGW